MTDAIHPIRLVGGRYDGDQGELETLPPVLWAMPCGCKPACYGINNIHWAYGISAAALVDDTDDTVVEYRYSHAEKDAHVYTWKTLMRDPSRALREAMHA